MLGVVTLYHWLFSFAFAFVYVVWSIYWPTIRLWHSTLFDIITFVMHGFFIALLGFRNSIYADGCVGWLWNLN
ncbi:DUF1440 domain-containing protein [Bartonella sp. HY761]|uniref:DUF1440 domain-containing protein n=1 Tax=Bartonella sp. HY761 TaxID=2979330 RepID=UPI003FA3B29A